MATAALRRHAARIPSAQHVDPNAQDAVLPAPTAVPTTTVRGGMLRECADRLDQEDDAGSVEYKWRLVGVSEMRLQHLMTQMQFRVGEGGGECIYELGVEDDGVPRGLDPDDYQQSLATLRRMASRLGFTMTILFERVVLTEPVLMRCAEIRIRNVSARLACVRIAMMGQTGVGKSTLTSVLSNGVFDNGSGSARQSVFNHRHELETGRTSSVSRRLLGFDRSGDIINYEATTGHESSKYVFDAAELCNEGLVQRSASLIALMDLPGDTRCQTTAWRALLGRRPHCGCIVMSATDTAAPEEQMHLFASLDIPFFIVLTNQDRVTSVSALADLTAKINGAVQRIVPSKRARVASLRSTPVASPSKAPMSKADSFDFFIDDGADDVIEAEIALPSGVGMNKHDSDDLFISTPQSAGDKMQFPATTAGGALAGASVLASSVPLFVVSSVNGHGIDALRRFLHRVSVDATFKPPVEASATPTASAAEAAVLEPKTVLVHDLIIRDGVTIALGTVARNKIAVDDQLCIGPFGTSGIYYPVTVESIQIERLFASEACTGVDASFALDGPGADPELWTEGNQSSCSKKRCLVLTEPNNASKVTKCTVAAKLQAGMPRVDKAWSNLRENHETLFLCGCAKVPVRIHSKGPDASTAILSWTSPLHIDAGAFAAILTPAGVIVPLVVLNINPVTSSTPTKSPTSNIPTDDARSASQENGDTDGSSSTASPDSHHAPSATDSSSQSVGGLASEVLRSAAATECTNGKSPLDRRTARAGKRKHEKRNGCAAAPAPTSVAPTAAITATTEHSSHVAAESKPVE